MKTLSLVVALLFVIESVVTQAPGDGSEICLPGGAFDFLRFTIPENMKVLMESRDYETLLGNSGEPRTWQQVDVDGNVGDGGTTTIWTQQGDRGCQQIVTVCGFDEGQQNNWLITQHSSRQTTTLLPQITVIVEYEFSNCEIIFNCARTFSVWKYDRSTVDATLARDTSKYTQVAAIALEDTTGSVRQNETIEIDFSGSETGFYLAIRDEDSCLLIHRILVFYYVCPAITENLIIHPEILAPPISPTSEPINVDGGQCVPNATPTQGSNPILTCSQGGIWSVIVSCTCDPGFSMNVNGTACIAELTPSCTIPELESQTIAVGEMAYLYEAEIEMCRKFTCASLNGRSFTQTRLLECSGNISTCSPDLSPGLQRLALCCENLMCSACSFQICPDDTECVLVDSEASCQCTVGFEKNNNDECVAIAELDLSFTGDSPQLGVGIITAELFTNRPGVQIACFLQHTTFMQDCSNGSVAFTNVPAGGYTLRVVATDRETLDRAVIVTQVFVPPRIDFCSVNAINRLVSISGNSSSVEFRSTGNPTDFRCRVDRMSFSPCTSPVTITGLDSGRHRLRVRPRGCGRANSGHSRLSIAFNI